MTTPGLTTDDLAGRPPRNDHDATAPYPDEPAHGEPPHDAAGAQPPAEQHAPVVDDATADDFIERWAEVQSRFVDDPRAAVTEADGLVAELMRTLAERFSEHKRGLEDEWTRGDEPDTESLRRALQQYRSFFDRLLNT